MARGQADLKSATAAVARPPALSRATWKSIFRKSNCRRMSPSMWKDRRSLARRRREKEGGPGPQAGRAQAE